MVTKHGPETLGFLIADVSRLMRAEFDRRTSTSGKGLTPGEARTLSHAARAGVVRQTVLAERMGLEAMTLSVYLDRLEAHGLVRRMPDPTDRRAKLVHTTDAAAQVMEEIAQVGAALNADIAGELTAPQLEEIREALRHIRSNLIAMRPDCVKGSSAA